jgi:hypothetical protein
VLEDSSEAQAKLTNNDEINADRSNGKNNLELLNEL